MNYFVHLLRMSKSTLVWAVKGKRPSPDQPKAGSEAGKPLWNGREFGYRSVIWRQRRAADTPSGRA